MFRLLIAFVIGYVIYRAGVWMIRTFMQAPPPPLPAGEMRRIKMQYRCSLCGAEARMTLATTENPDPPRHCMEDMDLIRATDE